MIGEGQVFKRRMEGGGLGYVHGLHRNWKKDCAKEKEAFTYTGGGDLSPRYLSNIERGRSIPSIDVLMQIADVLHMTPDEVLLGADGMQKGELSGQLAANLKRLDKKQQEQALSFIAWLGTQESAGQEIK